MQDSIKDERLQHININKVKLMAFKGQEKLRSIKVVYVHSIQVQFLTFWSVISVYEEIGDKPIKNTIDITSLICGV